MNDWEDHSGKVLGQAVRLSKTKACVQSGTIPTARKKARIPSLLTALTRTRTASYSSLLLEIESTIARFLLDYSLRG